MKEEKSVEGTFTLDDMYLIHTALCYLGNSIDHFQHQILQIKQAPEVMERLESLAAKIDRVIGQLEDEKDTYH